MAEIDVIQNDIKTLKESDSNQWTAIDKLRDRFDLLSRKWLPVWVSIVMTAMGTLTGSAISVAIMAIIFAAKIKE